MNILIRIIEPSFQPFVAPADIKGLTSTDRLWWRLEETRHRKELEIRTGFFFFARMVLSMIYDRQDPGYHRQIEITWDIVWTLNVIEQPWCVTGLAYSLSASVIIPSSYFLTLIMISLLIIFAHPPTPYSSTCTLTNRSWGGPGGLATGFFHRSFVQESRQSYYLTVSSSTQNIQPLCLSIISKVTLWRASERNQKYGVCRSPAED